MKHKTFATIEDRHSINELSMNVLRLYRKIESQQAENEAYDIVQQLLFEALNLLYMAIVMCEEREQ